MMQCPYIQQTLTDTQGSLKALFLAQELGFRTVELEIDYAEVAGITKDCWILMRRYWSLISNCCTDHLASPGHNLAIGVTMWEGPSISLQLWLTDLDCVFLPKKSPPWIWWCVNGFELGSTQNFSWWLRIFVFAHQRLLFLNCSYFYFVYFFAVTEAYLTLFLISELYNK